MAKQEVVASAPDVEVKFQITVDAYCFRSEFPVGLKKEEPTYFDAFEIVARNNGNALARHIQGAIELPRGVLFDHFRELDLKNRDPVIVIAQTKPIKLEFSNYLREPAHSYLAKPNPLEWKPLLPGRKMKLFSERALPLRERFHEMEDAIKWELAVDNCKMQRGGTRFADIRVVLKST
jgi:hypothetical protein